MNNFENNFTYAVGAYHRAIVTYRYTDALEYAKSAVEHAPCDLEASRWADEVRSLENKLSSGTTKLARFLGLKR